MIPIIDIIGYYIIIIVWLCKGDEYFFTYIVEIHRAICSSESISLRLSLTCLPRAMYPLV